MVSYLEAFNITHDTYRDVQVSDVASAQSANKIHPSSIFNVRSSSTPQNTRIIKDLQALRQNKANDQILAKRIKNLLRKWKERLAATTAAIQSSQPNSPQNMSQGSSDTQFITQQSQSPPISQLPNHQRVNGPTSFSNLLPKPQIHHKSIITSPASFPYQNGQNSSQSLLGKRKFDANDVDVNSNHSTRKLMKKSISSPLASINHNHQLNPPIPAVPAPLPPEDAPKKRGRKKGSKGIDSMLNGAIPDFQAEIQRNIALSAGKRNKTTMELQQMLESHQNTATSWTNGDVDSSSLDPGWFASLHRLVLALTVRKTFRFRFHVVPPAGDDARRGLPRAHQAGGESESGARLAAIHDVARRTFLNRRG